MVSCLFFFFFAVAISAAMVIGLYLHARVKYSRQSILGLIELRGIGEEVLRRRWRITSRRIGEVVQKGSLLQEIWR